MQRKNRTRKSVTRKRSRARRKQLEQGRWTRTKRIVIKEDQ
jgi:hypothetical protein